jgi:HSP20 family protein
LSTKRDLLKRIEALQGRIHSIFEESPIASQNLPGDHLPSSWSPAVDIYETDQEYVLTAEVPGLERDKIDLQIVNNVLFLRGERDSSKESPRQVYHRLERPSGSFERQFSLPEEVSQDKIRAQMTEGVLVVVLPKRQVRPQAIRVEINKKRSL